MLGISDPEFRNSTLYEASHHQELAAHSSFT